MKAKVLHKFFDVKAKVDRKPGEEFEATAARIEEINAAGARQKVGALVEAVEEKKPAKTKKKDEVE